MTNPMRRLRKVAAFLSPPVIAKDAFLTPSKLDQAKLTADERGKVTTNTPTLMNACEGTADVVNASASSLQTRPLMQLENDFAVLELDLAGGSLSSFTLKQTENDREPTNPLSWRAQATTDGSPASLGHFLCCDRWGAPSEAELANGMPFHGEAATQVWRPCASQRGTSNLRAGMTATLPMAGMSVERQVSMAEHAAAVHVVEIVSNTNSLGRMYNMVQHPSIAPPFLDEETVVDSNATLGFPQSAFPSVEECTSRWPQALQAPTVGVAEGTTAGLTDMRRLAAGENDVCSFVIEEEFGWVTAVSPTAGLLIGYLWRSEDYPWLSSWRNSDANGAPAARGLEFGTTGVHQPFPELADMPTVLGRPTFSYLDASAAHTRSYCLFLCPVEGTGLDSGVNSVSYSPKLGELVLTGANGATVTLVVGKLM